MTDFVFIDSGVGGIPYMTALLQKEPNASCVYVADNANFPYGEKTHEQVVSFVTNLVQKICDKFEPRVIVLACNTISVNALEAVRKEFSNVKFVGTVPAIKLAASVSKKKRIGLIATSSTCENPYNIEVIVNLAQMYRLNNEFIKPIELYNNLLKFDKHNSEYYYSLGILYKDLKDKNNAIKFLEKACNIDKNNKFYLKKLEEIKNIED